MTGSVDAGDRRPILVRATEEAIALRGTVMLEAADEPRRWCAVCASVQGDLEVRVAEPPRGWRRWKAAPGEEWLARNEFTHRIDAWTRPLRARVSARECAAVLDDALSRALGLAPATTLRRSLVVPGVLPGTDAPAGGADYGQHLTSALRGLVAAGDGSVHVECGRPARPLAWVSLVDGLLVVEIEARDASGTEVELGRFPPSPSGATDGATALSERLKRDFACEQPVPLFVDCMATDSSP